MFYNASVKDKLLRDPGFDVVPTLFDLPNPPKPVTSKRTAPKPRDNPVPQKKKKNYDPESTGPTEHADLGMLCS